MTRYEHTQIGHAIIWPLVVVILIANGLTEALAYRPAMFLLLIPLVCLVLFYKLRIIVGDETLCAAFGIGVVRQRVPVAKIAVCEPIRIKWRYGWGIHRMPYGWLYNVSEFDAVAISLQDRRKFALGTDDPDGLTTAILAGIS